MSKMCRLTVKTLILVLWTIVCLFTLSCDNKNKAEVDILFENLLVGTWVSDSEVLGGSYFIETYNPDGTWQRGGDSLSIISTGKWTLAGNDTIRIHETGVKVGSTYRSLDNTRNYVIIGFENDKLTCINGEDSITLHRRE